jgi:hypothetical protein
MVYILYAKLWQYLPRLGKERWDRFG